MSNRRRPTRPVPLDGSPPVALDDLPEILRIVEWSDTPASRYDQHALRSIAGQVDTIGRLNVWQCELCGIEVLCFDRHPGTTPYTVSHATLGEPGCEGTCKSHFYSGLSAGVARDRLGGPSHEWYRPSANELAQLDRGVREHVALGGLLVRDVARAPSPYRPPAYQTGARR